MKVLVLGAHGQIARLVETQLAAEAPEIQQTWFLRDSQRLASDASPSITLFEGDAANEADIQQALQDVNLVYANLSGSNIEAQATAVVKGMKKSGVSRLIWISTLGIYDEVPGAYGKWNHDMLDGGYLETYRAAAKIIETSGLDYTIIRPAWLSNKTEVDYELTEKGTTFKGTEVSRASVADLVVKIIQNPDLYQKSSLGVNKPNTDGDKPEWYR